MKEGIEVRLKKTALLLAFLTALFAVRLAHADSGNMDIDRYCRSKYGPASHAVLTAASNPYGWKCFMAAGDQYVDMQDVCLVQYGPRYGPVLSDQRSARSWKCDTH